MRAVPLHLQDRGLLDVAVAYISGKLKREQSFGSCYELNSALEPRRSPSPPTSTSTLSTSLGGAAGGSSDTAGVASVGSQAASDAGTGRRDEWPSDLPPISGPSPPDIPASAEWEHMLSDSAAGEHSFFRWFMNDSDDPSLKHILQTGAAVAGSADFDAASFADHPVVRFDGSNSAPLPLPSSGDYGSNGGRATSKHHDHLKSSMMLGSNLNLMSNQIMSTSSNLPPLPISAAAAVNFQEATMDEKPQILNPQQQLLINPQQLHHPHPNPAFLPISYDLHQHQQFLLPRQAQRHQPALADPSFPFADPAAREPLPPQPGTPGGRVAKSKAEDVEPHQALIEQLVKAAELIDAGNSVSARGILARLNHQLSDVGKPLRRVAFYFKEALQLLLHPSASPAASSPLDVVFKISAYKVFSEISPVVQFTSFTSNQSLLEALDGFDRIHVVDFDIGIGGQWASFMQELAVRRSGVPCLRITAFASAASHHPLELCLTRENLTQFANELNVSFEFNVINLDAINLSSAASFPILDFTAVGEAVAVNFAAGSLPNLPAALLLRLVKQLSPKIVLSVDHGCDRGDVPFVQYFIRSLQSYSLLLESLDAVNVNSDAVRKIERYLLQPRIENTVLGCQQRGEKMPSWRTLFASAGFSPLTFSNFTETQAECMLRRLQLRGFHVEKRQASLYLCWQHRELVSVSAWRC